ncbi:MAG: MEDS domain-containing protein [Candidatus Nitrosotalea sp.]|nr:MEDS domain-containing protein [Candidatus Nitrosotalea sp.]
MTSQLFFGSFDSKKHLMLVCDDVAIRQKIEFEFIKNGLDKNELSIYATHGDEKLVEKEMLSFGIDVNFYKKNGLLKILHIGNPAEDSLDFIDSIQALLKKMLPNPEIPFRVVGRVMPDVGTEIAIAIQAKWEKMLHNNIFDNLNGSILCTYDLSQIQANNQWMMWLKELQKNHHAYVICKNGKSNLTINS